MCLLQFGAASVKPNSDHIERMRKFGELMNGLPIKDDLFDYGNDYWKATR